MIENRELNMDDYLAMLRRRMRVILLPALLAPFAGFLVSFAFPTKYTSSAQVLVEEQKVPEGYVKPVITEDVMERIVTIEQTVLSPGRLRPMIERVGLAKGGKSVDQVIEQIQKNFSISPLVPEISATSGSGRKPKAPSSNTNEVPGFSLSFVSNDPSEAREICSQLTSMMLEENYNVRQEVAHDTTVFLGQQLEQARRDLEDKDAKLAAFKKQYIGQLPGDEESNLKILTGLNSQLEANTQTLNRAQQDRTYAESVLAQQVAAWKATQTSEDPHTLEKQLALLQSQLITLRARYTDDHPDVVKTKNDIAEINRKLQEINSATSKEGDTPTGQGSAGEPPEIRQLRLQIHQYDQSIAQATRNQKRLQQQIDVFQGRVAISPTVEEQYKQLTRDYDTAQKFYDSLLTKKSESEMQTEMERGQQGEQMHLVSPASLPDSPDFPNRWLFAAGGLGAGLALGCGIALWLELRDKSIRTEQDVLAVLELPMLASLPWIRPDADNKNGRTGRSREEKQTVEV